jgi:excisionase family DNA binding protein
VATADNQHRPATAPDCLTAAQVAAFLQIPSRTVAEYAARGLLPSVRIGRHLRFSRAALHRQLFKEES